MRFYDELAEWWPLLSAPADYEEEAAFFLRTLRAHAAGAVTTMLELGSGGGNTASHLRDHVALTLVEPAAGMREVSAALNPKCEHLTGDMRDVRLGRTFDAILAHDSVNYMTTLADLRAAITTTFEHCRPGGAALFFPDQLRDRFEPGTCCGGHDDPATDRGLRYLEWTRPDPHDDSRYLVDYAFTLRRGDDIEVVHDQHVLGLFPTRDWLATIAAAGFTPELVPFEHSEFEPGERHVFVGRRPTAEL